MKKYRIKIVIYKTYRKEYYAQVKKWWGWIGVSHFGKESFYASYQNTYEHAEKAIHNHLTGNTQKIRTEYIDIRK